MKQLLLRLVYGLFKIIHLLHNYAILDICIVKLQRVVRIFFSAKPPSVRLISSDTILNLLYSYGFNSTASDLLYWYVPSANKLFEKPAKTCLNRLYFMKSCLAGDCGWYRIRQTASHERWMARALLCHFRPDCGIISWSIPARKWGLWPRGYQGCPPRTSCCSAQLQQQPSAWSKWKQSLSVVDPRDRTVGNRSSNHILLLLVLQDISKMYDNEIDSR